MWKCFWSQILLMKMNKSYCTMPALTKLQTRGDLNLLLAGQPVNESEWHQCQKPVHGRSFPITTKLLVTTIEIFWVMWLQSQIPSSWGVRSPDPHRRVGRGTWLCYIYLLSGLWNIAVVTSNVCFSRFEVPFPFYLLIKVICDKSYLVIKVREVTRILNWADSGFFI